MNRYLTQTLTRILPPCPCSGTFYIIDGIYHSFKPRYELRHMLADWHNLEKVDIYQNNHLLRHNIQANDLLGNFTVNLSFLTRRDLNKLMHCINGNIDCLYVMISNNGKHITQINIEREKVLLYDQLFKNLGQPSMFVTMLSREVLDCIPNLVPSFWICFTEKLHREDFTVVRTLELVEFEVKLGRFYSYCDANQYDILYEPRTQIPLSYLKSKLPAHQWLERKNEPLLIMQRMFERAQQVLHIMDEQTGHMVPLISLGNKIMHSLNGNIERYLALIIIFVYIWLVSMNLWNKLMHAINGNIVTYYDLVKMCSTLLPTAQLVSGNKIPDYLMDIFKSVLFYVHHFARGGPEEETLAAFDKQIGTFKLDKKSHNDFLNLLSDFKLTQCLNSLVPRTLTYKLIKQINGHGL